LVNLFELDDDNFVV